MNWFFLICLSLSLFLFLPLTHRALLGFIFRFLCHFPKIRTYKSSLVCHRPQTGKGGGALFLVRLFCFYILCFFIKQIYCLKIFVRYVGRVKMTGNKSFVRSSVLCFSPCKSIRIYVVTNWLLCLRYVHGRLIDTHFTFFVQPQKSFNFLFLYI